MGSFIRIGPGIEEGEPSLCGGAPRAVIPGGILKCRDPACTHPKTYLSTHAVMCVLVLSVRLSSPGRHPKTSGFDVAEGRI